MFVYSCIKHLQYLTTFLFLQAVTIFKAIQYEPKNVTSPDIYPKWADVIWWLITIFAIISIPLWFLVDFCINGGYTVISNNFKVVILILRYFFLIF